MSEDEPSKPLELEALEFDKDLFESMSSKKQKYIMLRSVRLFPEQHLQSTWELRSLS